MNILIEVYIIFRDTVMFYEGVWKLIIIDYMKL